jgi:magnesium transporter
MIRYYKTIDSHIVLIPREEPGCWIYVLSPTKEELAHLTDELGLDAGFVSAGLDEEETSRIEKEEDQVLIVVDLPTKDEEQNSEAIAYTTIPLGIIITPDYFVTVSTASSSVTEEIAAGTVRGIQTNFRSRFLLAILLRIAQRFLFYLRQIDRLSSRMESQLNDSTKNEALLQVLELEKSLVYFSSSLKADEATLNRISRGRLLTMYDEDEELLDDVIIEFKQAIEMANIYANILSGTMDAYASIINNNLNSMMKILTAVTVLMTIPTMIFSYYGMNVAGLQNPVWWFPTLLSVGLALIVLIVLIKFKMFK